MMVLKRSKSMRWWPNFKKNPEFSGFHSNTQLPEYETVVYLLNANIINPAFWFHERSHVGSGVNCLHAAVRSTLEPWRQVYLRFEVFTAVTMKKAVFWDVVPCKNCVNQRFGGTYHLHLQA
jgi:hypothetical protein